MLASMPAGTTKSERRKGKRKRPPSLVYVELEPTNGGMMRDVSETGFSVRVVQPLEPGNKTPFSFSLSETERVDGEGKILWVEEGGRVAGIEFTQIPPGAKTLIRNWMKRPAEYPEGEAKRAAQETVTREQLRRDIRSVPPREKAGEGGHVVPAPEPKPSPIPPAAETTGSAQAAQSAEPAAPAARPREQQGAPEMEPVVEKAAAPPVPERPPSSSTTQSAEPVSAVNEQHGAAIGEKEPVPATPTAIPAGPETPPSPPAAQATEPVLRVTDTGELTVVPTLEHPPVSPVPPATSTIPPLPRVTLPRADSGNEVKQDPVFSFHPAARPIGAEGQSAVKKVEEEAAPHPELPDIKTILIPPTMSARRGQENVSKWRELTSAPRGTETPKVMRRERFTLGTAVAIMTILAVVVGVYVNQREVGQGLIWLGERMLGAARRDAVPPTPSNAVPPTPASESGKKGGQVNQRGRAEGRPTENTPSATPAAPAKSNPPATSPLSDVVPATGGGEEPGQIEYFEAMNLIRGNSGGTGSQEALRLLWVSVEKGNPHAEIVLADKYWHGDGVTKNCDQTRILLTAAARKGSAEGKKQLGQFEKEGCE